MKMPISHDFDDKDSTILLNYLISTQQTGRSHLFNFMYICLIEFAFCNMVTEKKKTW